MESKELERKIDELINHGISITAISEMTGIVPEILANYIYGVWKEKNKSNLEKWTKSISIYGYNLLDMTEEQYFTLLKQQGIIGNNEKKKVLSM